MYHLNVTQRQVLAPLLHDMEDSILKSCFAGWFGEAFADDLENPKIAGIIVADFAIVWGDANHPAACELLDLLFCRKEIILIPHDSCWHPVIERHFADRAQKIERYATKKDTVFDIDTLSELAQSLPAEYLLKLIDEPLFSLARAEKWSEDLCGNFKDYAHYAQRGIGVMALYQGMPIAGASSYTSYPDGIEIQIDTKKAHRQKGIATACGAKLILSSLDAGLYPNWDAMTKTSLHLAEKLGYQFSHSYVAYILSETPKQK